MKKIFVIIFLITTVFLLGCQQKTPKLGVVKVIYKGT